MKKLNLTGQMYLFAFLLASFATFITKSAEANVQAPVRLCCPSHFYYNTFNHTCVKSEEALYPTVYDDEDVKQEAGPIANITLFNTCDSYIKSEPYIQLMNNGFLKLSDDNYGDMVTLISPEDFCLLWTSSRSNSSTSALICFPDETIQPNYVSIMDRYVIPTIMGISAVFLAATFIIYWNLRETRDLLTKSFMCSIAMLCTTKTVGVIAIASVFYTYPKAFCITIGIMMHITFLSAFFWLNVISFILFSSIWYRGRVQMQCMKGRCFPLSCVYAFGVPLAFLIVILIHDLTNSLFDSNIPKPGFGDVSCGFSNRGAQFVFFYAPISVLLGVNLILFFLSAFKLCSQKTSATLFQFCYYLKLLLLMGIPWIFEVLSFFFMDKYTLSASTIFWYIFDIINAAQGILIFIVFVCHRKVLPRVLAMCCGDDFAKRKFPEDFKDKEDSPTEALTQQEFKLIEGQTTS